MATDLLATKLRIPPEPHHQLSRAALVGALERDVPRHRVTSVSAPAGYGKTTLLAQWARISRAPVAWVSLSEDDNDLERLLRSLVVAWTAVRLQLIALIADVPHPAHHQWQVLQQSPHLGTAGLPVRAGDFRSGWRS